MSEDATLSYTKKDLRLSYGLERRLVTEHRVSSRILSNALETHRSNTSKHHDEDQSY
jgi:hypothetical protein